MADKEVLNRIQEDVTEIKVTLAKNTESLEHHIKRTDTLQEMVDPVYQHYMAVKAVEEFKRKQAEERKQKRDAIIYSLKLPALVVAFLAALGTILAWLGFK